jgi:hypothetical protein
LASLEEIYSLTMAAFCQCQIEKSVNSNNGLTDSSNP